jgi:hypothetical protein
MVGMVQYSQPFLVSGRPNTQKNVCNTPRVDSNKKKEFTAKIHSMLYLSWKSSKTFLLDCTYTTVFLWQYLGFHQWVKINRKTDERLEILRAYNLSR